MARQKVTKPPYRVPSMMEINGLPWNGLNVVSTFSGCGGSCLGFRMAGYRVVWASEFVPAAADTYRANSSTPVNMTDIREVDAAVIRAESGLGDAEVDVLEGSPPCAAFSTAGKTSQGWGSVRKYSDTKQRVDDLFFEYARILGDLRPRAFVAENVAGLVKGVAKGYFKEILAALRAQGYQVRAKVLDAQWLGVPQMRHRLIFIGLRDDVAAGPQFPQPLPYRYSVSDALPHIDSYRFDTSGQWRVRDIDVQNEPAPVITVGAGSSASGFHRVTDRQPVEANMMDVFPKPLPYRYSMREVLPEIAELTGGRSGRAVGYTHSNDRPAPTVMAHGIHGVGPHQLLVSENSLDGTAIGEEWERLRPGEQSEKYFNLIRPDPDQPVPAVTATGGIRGAAAVTHPSEPRKFTITELKRLCSFPDDFVVTGSYQQQWERLGRAVPPVMMAHIAAALRDVLLEGSSAG